MSSQALAVQSCGAGCAPENLAGTSTTASFGVLPGAACTCEQRIYRQERPGLPHRQYLNSYAFMTFQHAPGRVARNYPPFQKCDVCLGGSRTASALGLQGETEFARGFTCMMLQCYIAVFFKILCLRTTSTSACHALL